MKTFVLPLIAIQLVNHVLRNHMPPRYPAMEYYCLNCTAILNWTSVTLTWLVIGFVDEWVLLLSPNSAVDVIVWNVQLQISHFYYSQKVPCNNQLYFSLCWCKYNRKPKIWQCISPPFRYTLCWRTIGSEKTRQNFFVSLGVLSNNLPELCNHQCN